MVEGGVDMTAPLALLGEFGDAISFIFSSRESSVGGTEIGGLGQVWELTREHLLLVAASMGAAMLVALPLGLWLGHRRKGAFLAISVSNVGRAVPSLALIAVLVAFLGTGFLNVTVALALLALPPILTNAYTAVSQVDRDLVDAARGQGMRELQIIRSIELPIALPLIFDGIRTSTVNVLATATIAPLAGVKTLGDPIISTSVYGDEGRLGAAIVVAVLAIVTEVGLGAAQRAVTPEGLKLEDGRTPRGRRLRAMGAGRGGGAAGSPGGRAAAGRRPSRRASAPGAGAGR
ncbi:MAG: ABC transporter permease, partial [Solirubrobacteraceae bacterium]